MVGRAVSKSFIFVLVTLSGCSTFDCCHWWGRNTDGSSNLGKKPAPIQQSPLAATYNNPGNSNTIMPSQLVEQPGQTPLVTTSPAQTYPSTVQPSNPAMTPPSPPPGIQNIAPVSSNTNIQSDDRNRSVISGSLPTPATSTMKAGDLPDNQPSIASPQPPTPQISGPTIPGNTSVETNPMPLLLSPPLIPAQNTTISMPTQSTISMPEIAVPNISKPMEATFPKAMLPSKNNSLNPGTSPPPLPPPPAIPHF